MSQIFAITMPKWGLEMTEGTLAAWHLSEGAAAAKGAELADIETAKIVNTLEADEAGTLRRLVAKVGDTLPVGALLAVVAAPEIPETDIANFIAAYRPLGEPPPPPVAVVSAPIAAAPQGEISATPVARRMASALGIELSAITGTGRNGRISQEDVEAYVAAQAAAPASAPVFQPFSATRKAIAATLVRTVQTVPSYLITMDVAMDKLLMLRGELNARPGQKISVNDFLIRAAALALADEPEVNVHVLEDGVRKFGQANISIAVAAEAGVLMPVIRDCGHKTLWEIAGAAADLAARARERKLTAEDMAEGSFSISNLGMFGVRQFEAIINAPQAAILAVGAARREALEGPNGVSFGAVMSVTLACDHRAIDGALGAKFLNAFKARIEQPRGLVEAA